MTSPRKGLLRRAWSALGRVDPATWCFVALGLLGAYGLWRAM